VIQGLSVDADAAVFHGALSPLQNVIPSKLIPVRFEISITTLCSAAVNPSAKSSLPSLASFPNAEPIAAPMAFAIFFSIPPSSLPPPLLPLPDDLLPLLSDLAAIGPLPLLCC
jgi:hypothetical protein